MATEDDKIDTGALGTVVAVGAVAMVGISLAVNALVRHEVGSLSVERDGVGANAYRAMKKEQLDKLSASAGWADQSKGHVAIPIDRAMNLTLADLKRSPWNATPAQPLDAGADAATESADAGTESADAGADAAPAPAADAGIAPEPPVSPPLSPSGAPAGSVQAPKPSAPRTLPPPTVPAVPPPPASSPAQPASPAPPATKP